MEELKDIKSNIEIVNSSLVDTIFIGTGIIIFLLILFFVYKLLRKIRK